MLSFSPISEAPVSGLAGGDIVVTAPAFVSTGSLSANLNDVLAQPLASTGSLSAGYAAVIPGADLVSTGSLSADFELGLTAAPLISSGALVADFAPFQIIGEIYRYFFTLTGAPNGTTDVEIPISSLQARLRSGDPTYLSVAIPYTTEYAAAINARPDGEMVLEMAMILNGEEVVRSEIARADLENIRIDEGTTSSTITLTGHKTRSFSPVAVTLESPVYRSVTDGAVRLRFAEPDLYLHPGDVVTCGDDTFTVDEISLFIGATDGGRITQNMEISES